MYTNSAPVLPCQRDRFDLPSDVTYLNCAYMGPLPRAALEAGQAGLARKARPWGIASSEFFTATEATRERAARLMGVPADDVAIVPSVSYGMGVAAAGTPLRPGQRVILLDEEFPSTIYPWRAAARRAGAEAVLVPRPADDDWTAAVLAAIDERAGAVAVPPCHWTDGGLLDLARIAARSREVGATLAVDATQSLGAMPLDLGVIRPDYLVAAAYKWLLGPYSVAFLHVAPTRQDGPALEETWMGREGSEDFAGLTVYRDRLRPGARRYDMGEVANLSLLATAAASLDLMLEWGARRVGATAGALAGQLARGAAEHGFRAVAADRRAPHYLGLRHPDGVPARLGQELALRGVQVSTRGPALRVTPHVYNDGADVARFLAALRDALDAARRTP